LTVFVYHAWLYSLPVVAASQRDSVGDDLLHELRLGLVLFFVLSGFLLYRPWVRAVREQRARPSTSRYAARRVARILPAYWLALVGAIVLLWGRDASPGVRLPATSDLWMFAVFAQNFTDRTLLKLDPPMWTLTVEVSFYVVLPLLGWLAARSGRRVGVWLVPVAFGAGGILFNWWMAARGDAPLFVSKILPAAAPYFALGMLAAVVLGDRRVGRGTMSALVAAGTALVVADSAWALWNAHANNSTAFDLKVWRDTLAAAGFAAIVAAIAGAARPPSSLVSRPIVWTGQVSYGLYLWHVPILCVLRSEGMLPSSPLLAALVALPPTLFVSGLSWRWLERPVTEWVRRRQTARGRGAQPGRGLDGSSPPSPPGAVVGGSEAEPAWVDARA
jgi:peptidoglycan/LPS O-acetylase OafA/YrhL